MFGDLTFCRADIQAMATRKDAGALAGFGMFPEGLETNSIVYAFAYDRAWAANPDDTVAQWLSGHLRARYGRTSPALEAAWADILTGAFRTRYWTTRWWKGEAGAYLFFKRPTLAAADFEGDPGDLAALRRGVRALAALATGLQDEPLYVHDLAQTTRHLATLEIDVRLPAAIRACRAGGDEGPRLLAEIGALALAIDALAGAENHGLAGWIAAARNYGDTPADKRAFVRDAKAQITVWGGEGNLNDYASKAWQGMYRSYYLPRWSLFLRALHAAASKGVAFDEAAWARDASAWEHAWSARETAYRHDAPRDPIAAVRDLMRAMPAV